MRRIFQYLFRYRVSAILLLSGALYVAFLILIHDITAGDYGHFVKQPIDIMYGIDRWFGWSSRLLIESSVNIFSKHLVLWKIITITSGALLFWSVGRILGVHRVYQGILLSSLMLLLGMYILTTAGIFATTINYLWPLACFAFIAAVVLRPFKNGVLHRLSLVVMWPMGVFAACSEQLAVLGVLLAGGYIAHRIYKKQKVSLVVCILLLVCLVGVVNVLVAPGNGIRKSMETVAWWPGFDTMSIFYKIKMGIVVTYSRLFMAPEPLAILMVLLVGILSYVKRNLPALISTLPAIIVLLMFIFPETYGTPASSSRLPNYFNEIAQRAMLFGPDNLPDSQKIQEHLIIFAAITISVMTSLYFLYRKSLRTVIILFVFAAGMVVSLAVSFSPTLFASTTRTLFPFLIILVCINYYLANQLIETKFYGGGRRNSRLEVK